MKAKTMLGLIVCASACVSLSAFANTTNDWFGVTVAGSNVSTVNITRSGSGSASGNQIILNDVDQDAALVLTPNADFAGTNRTDDIYVISAKVVLNPCSTNDFRYVDVSSARAGVVVGIDDLGATNYYGYAGSAWHLLTNATVVASGDETTFCIVLNYRDEEAYFMVRDNEEEKWNGPYGMPNEGASALANIKVWGTGSISSVTGAFEVAEAQYNGKKYGSVAEAMKEVPGGSSYDEIAVVGDDGEPKPTTADGNGLMPWQNKAMGVLPDDQVRLAKASDNQNANKITLSAVLPNKEAGVDVKFCVMCNDEQVGGPCAADNIQIPMGDSQGFAVYTIVPQIEAK